MLKAFDNFIFAQVVLFLPLFFISYHASVPALGLLTASLLLRYGWPHAFTKSVMLTTAIGSIVVAATWFLGAPIATRLIAKILGFALMGGVLWHLTMHVPADRWLHGVFYSLMVTLLVIALADLTFFEMTLYKSRPALFLPAALVTLVLSLPMEFYYRHFTAKKLWWLDIIFLILIALMSIYGGAISSALALQMTVIVMTVAAVLALIIRQRQTLIRATWGVIVGLSLLTPIALQHLSNPALYKGSDARVKITDISVLERLYAWDYLAQHITLRGHGLGASKRLLDRDFHMTFGPDIKTGEILQNKHSFSHPHNTILQIWIEMGLLGIIGMAGILWRVLAAVQRVRHPLLFAYTYAAVLGTGSTLIFSYDLWSSFWWAAQIFVWTMILLIIRAQGHHDASLS